MVGKLSKFYLLSVSCLLVSWHVGESSVGEQSHHRHYAECHGALPIGSISALQVSL
jgi:hypothetical protein